MEFYCGIYCVSCMYLRCEGTVIILLLMFGIKSFYLNSLYLYIISQSCFIVLCYIILQCTKLCYIILIYSLHIIPVIKPLDSVVMLSTNHEFPRSAIKFFSSVGLFDGMYGLCVPIVCPYSMFCCLRRVSVLS